MSTREVYNIPMYDFEAVKEYLETASPSDLTPEVMEILYQITEEKNMDELSLLFDGVTVQKRSLDWDSLSLEEPVSRERRTRAIAEEDWQRFRRGLKGTDLDEKYSALRSWVDRHDGSILSQIQVSNYVDALRRAGQVPPRNA